MKSLRKLSLVYLLLFGFNVNSQQSEKAIKEWKEDLHYLKEFAEQSHFNLFHTLDHEEWKKEIKKIENEIPEMENHQIILSMMRLLAKVKDGHTVLYPPYQGKYAFHSLPLEFYFFGEDLYVRAAQQNYEILVGKKIVKAAGRPISDLLTKLQSNISHDNLYQVKWITPLALQYAEVYSLMESQVNFDSVEFTYLENGKEKTVSVLSGPLQWNPMSSFAMGHWVQMASLGNNLWTKDPNNFYWYEYLEQNQMVYFQFNRIRDKEEQSIASFIEEMFEFIENNQVKILVIDIRLNNGGNSFLNKPLVHELICNKNINQKGQLFVITGRRTFSAAMCLASDLEQNTNAIFVGEPTGSSPNFYGEENNFKLPNSGLTGSISSRYWLGGPTSDDNRKWISPELPAQLSADEFRNGVDPSMQVIIQYIGNDG